MTHYIHPSHKGYGDQENLPHAHVCFGNKNDKSTQVSVSLTNCKAIVTGKNLTYKDQKEAEGYVRRNLKTLQAEWERKSECDW